jgi:hypothetical protein
LVFNREVGEPLDLVAPQVDTHGSVLGRREYVDDGTAHGDLATMFYL